MLDPKTTIEDAIKRLRAEIKERQQALTMLERLIVPSAPPPPSLQAVASPAIPAPAPPPTSVPAPVKRRRPGAGKVALQILREAGHPMHGVENIYPELVRRGVSIQKTAVQTALSREAGIRKIKGQPNTWEAIPEED